MPSENKFNEHFAKRLKDSMEKAGYASPRCAFGVSIHKLTEITGHSPQICRKYVRGEVLPDLNKLVTIASKLNVSPAWLLFGEHNIAHKNDPQQMILNKELLAYLFGQVRNLYQSEFSTEEIVSFLIELINDLNHIDASINQSKRIIDLALNSIKHFNEG